MTRATNAQLLKGYQLGGLLPFAVNRPEPDAQRHRVLRNRAWRSMKFLGRLSTRESVFRKAPKLFHIIRRHARETRRFCFFVAIIAS